MDSKNQNHFNNPVVIILVLALVVLGGYFLINKNQNVPQDSTPNSQQSEIDALKKTVEDLKNSKPTDVAPKEINSTDIAKEWRKRTAHVDCTWYYSDGTPIQELSGSGLIAIFNSVPTITTNKHVVYSPTYGYAGRCGVQFPDDEGTYVYTKDLSWYPSYGNLTIDSGGADVAYLTDLHWVHLIDFKNSELASDQMKEPPYMSLTKRSGSGSFICSNSENVGNPILILGYPVYGSQANFLDLKPIEPTITDGIISGKDGVYYTTSAKIDHGNSGGLAIDETNDCYFGIPTWNESGSFESLGRILPASIFLK